MRLLRAALQRQERKSALDERLRLSKADSSPVFDDRRRIAGDRRKQEIDIRNRTPARRTATYPQGSDPD